MPEVRRAQAGVTTAQQQRNSSLSMAWRGVACHRAKIRDSAVVARRTARVAACRMTRRRHQPVSVRHIDTTPPPPATFLLHRKLRQFLASDEQQHYSVSNKILLKIIWMPHRRHVCRVR